MTAPTCTPAGTVASTLGVPHGVGSAGSLGFHVSATKPGPTSLGVSRAAPAWLSIETSPAALLDVAATVVVGAAVVGTVAVAFVSLPPLLQPAARSAAAMAPS